MLKNGRKSVGRERERDDDDDDDIAYEFSLQKQVWSMCKMEYT